MPTRLKDAEVSDLLSKLDGWLLTDAGKIKKEFRFRNFKQAMEFMNDCAVHAEKINHHPEWSNIYNKVWVELVTHDCDGLSALDSDMASFMDALART
jgi:4a-hydroxytetrahydrobiopterin dehydratase